MAPLSSYLSFTSLYTFYLRRCFTSAGLSEKAMSTDHATTVQFWGPTSPSPNKPSLLLIHGFGPVAIWQWRRQVQYLAPHYNLYVPNLVFFGESHTTSTERSEVFQAETVAALMEKLGVERYSVVGTSYGGFVAYHLARMFPERVDKVVVASSGINMRPADNDELVKRAKVESIGDLMLPQTASHLRALLGVAVSAASVRRVPDFVLHDLINKLYAEKRSEKLELLNGLTLGQDETPSLSPLQQDVLLIWGEEDKIFPLKMAHELKGLIGKNVKLEIMRKASHVPQIEDSAQFNRIAHAFLSS